MNGDDRIDNGPRGNMERLEVARAGHRSKARQDKQVPLLIRDDGMLFPNVPLIAKKKNFRPYHGNPNATLEERMAYLAGRAGRRVMASMPFEDDEPFDISTADRNALIDFAEAEYGEIMDPELSTKEIKVRVARLAGLIPPAASKGPVNDDDGGGDSEGGTADVQPEATRAARRAPAAKKAGLGLPATEVT